VVLLVLAIVWAAVLGPSLLRRRAERSGDSIGAFHRQLRVLERTGPTVIDPAHTLQARRPFRLPRPASGFPVVRPDAPLRPVRGRRPDPYFRADACRRRRNILLGLLGATFLSAVLAVAAHPMLYIAVTSVVLLVGYVSLLVYLRTLAAEREAKLRYLPQAVDAEPGVAARRLAAR
jgi:hypothetical protein